MRLPIIQSCLRCAYIGADERCHHPRGADVEPIMDDGPPPPTCPARTGPDEERREAIETSARAVVRWSWPEMPQQWRDDLEALRVALGERKDGAE